MIYLGCLDLHYMHKNNHNLPRRHQSLFTILHLEEYKVLKLMGVEVFKLLI